MKMWVLYTVNHPGGIGRGTHQFSAPLSIFAGDIDDATQRVRESIRRIGYEPMPSVTVQDGPLIRGVRYVRCFPLSKETGGLIDSWHVAEEFEVGEW